MFVWTPDMIRFMQAANERNDYHARLAAILAPKLSNCRTLCDAGCGLGALSAALSPYFASITAADVSGEALNVLRRTIHAQQLGNITPLQCDLLTSEDRTQYDAMLFCFFGSLAEILPVARRQCAKTLIIIKKNYDLHRFSLTDQPIRGETASAAKWAFRSSLTRRNWSTGSRLHRWTMLSGFSASTAGTRTPAQLHPKPSCRVCGGRKMCNIHIICRRPSGLAS